MTTVLVVEDNVEFGIIISEFLRYKGYQVQNVRSAEAAIEILNNEAIDVAIADLYLVGNLTGIDVLLRHKKLYPKGCRILFTAAISDMVRSVCLYIDTVCLEKPFPLDELVQKVESMLEINSH
ncbi:MAG: response regulator [Candidatus Binatia bacterium]